jgi:hypothetical protein
MEECSQVFVVLAVAHNENSLIQLMFSPQGFLIAVAAEPKVMKSGREVLAHPIQQMTKIGIIQPIPIPDEYQRSSER